VPNFNGEEGDYVDFLSVEDILNSPNEDYGEFMRMRRIICLQGK
jgi:hypothetical protein